MNFKRITKNNIQNQTKTTLVVKVVSLLKKDRCYRYFGLFSLLKAKHEMNFITKVILKGYFRIVYTALLYTNSELEDKVIYSSEIESGLYKQILSAKIKDKDSSRNIIFLT